MCIVNFLNILSRMLSNTLFVLLRFYGPVNTLESCRSRSVNLTTHCFFRAGLSNTHLHRTCAVCTYCSDKKCDGTNITCRFLHGNIVCDRYSAFTNWAVTFENMTQSLYRQQRPRSAYSSAQSDQGLPCTITESLDTTKYIDEEQSSGLPYDISRILELIHKPESTRDCADAHVDLDLHCSPS